MKKNTYIYTINSSIVKRTTKTTNRRLQLRVRKAEPVERSKTRISIVQAVTSHVRFQKRKIIK